MSKLAGNLKSNTGIKLLLSLLFTLVISFSSVVSANGQIVPDGDLTGEATVDVADALRALRIAVGLITPIDQDMAHGDVAPLVNDGPAPDGKIDVSDALIILKKVVGLISWGLSPVIDEIVVGGNGVSQDDNLMIIPFSNDVVLPVTASAKTLGKALMLGVSGVTEAKLSGEVPWVSQFTSGCETYNFDASPGSIYSPGLTMSSTTVGLNWTQVSGATYYELGVKDIASGTLVVDTQVSGISYSASLPAGNQYRWNLAACNSGGCSVYSTPLFFQTPGSRAEEKNVPFKSFRNYGFCGPTSVLMAASYMKAPRLTTLGEETGEWIRENVRNWTEGNKEYKNKFFDITKTNPFGELCGGNGTGPSDLVRFSDFLGAGDIKAEEFPKNDGSSNAEAWIKAALISNSPVAARVHYQGYECRGKESIPVLYGDGINVKPVEMKECYSPGTNIQMGHWVLVTRIDENSVTVQDPDPFAYKREAGGVRKYTKESFFHVLQKNNVNGPIAMVKFSQPNGREVTPAYSISSQNIEIVSDTTYRSGQAPTVANPMVSGGTFSATGLPSGLSLDTEGQIAGKTTSPGTYSINVLMRKVLNGVERVADAAVTLVVKAAAQITDALQFITHTQLTRGKTGLTYFQPMGVSGTTGSVTFSRTAGSLPPGLSIQQGQIVGIPTLPGEYSFDLEAASSTGSKVTKTFVLAVDPAEEMQVPAPILTSISPMVMNGLDGQQPLVLAGSGFIEGTIVELTDMTYGGTYRKVPVSINASGTELTIRANFTSAAATWTTRVFGPTGLSSSTIMFTVAAPQGGIPVITSITPSVLMASSDYQSITISGTNFLPSASVELTNLTSGVRTTLQPITATSAQLTVNNIFASPTTWSVRVKNADGNFSETIDIRVKASATISTISPPGVPAATSPGNIAGPGVMLSDPKLTMTWSSLSAATYYNVAVRDLNVGNLVLDAITTENTYSLNLLPGKQYRWNVAACNSAGCSNYTTPLYFQTPGASPTVPATPGSPSPGTTSSPGPTTSSDTVALSWSSVSGATYYSFGVRDMTTNQLVVDQTSTGTSYSAALSSGKQYRWNVAACNSAGCSNYTTPLYFQTPGASPTVPATPTSTSPGTTSSPGPTTSSATVALSWSSVSGATYYDFGVRDMATDQLVVNQTSTGTSYSAALSSGKQYRWNVAACNSAGCSNYTTPLYFQTPGASPTVPATPTSPSPGTTTSPGPTASSTTVALSWSSVSGATYYDFGVRDMATDQLVVNQTSTGTSYSAALSSGKQYRWNVAACNSAGCSNYTTPLYFQTPGASPTVPATPTSPSPGTTSSPGPTASSTTVALSWSSVSGATYYDFGVRDMAIDQLVVNQTSTGTSYSAALSSGKQYRWNVAACNSAGCSNYTTPLYFQTPGASPTVPATPTSPSPGTTSSPGPTASSTTVALSWSSVGGATYYDFGVRDMATNQLVVSQTSTGTSYSAALSAGKQYRWNVAACNSAGCSNYTTLLYFQTPGASPTVPATPTSPSPGTTSSPGPTTSSTTVALSWSSVNGATYYSFGVRDMTTNQLVVDQTSTGTSYSAALSSGKQYRWNVAACNSAGCSNYTTPLYFKTP
jgi:hypothetical protein